MTAFQSVARIDLDADDDTSLESMEDEAARRWALGMQVVESCVEVVDGARGPRYVGRVLGKLPQYKGDGEAAPAPPADDGAASEEPGLGEPGLFEGGSLERGPEQ